MKINYEDIITKANVRKDTLRRLEVEFIELRDMAKNLKDSLQYFINLSAIRSELDVEGHALLGRVDGALYFVVSEADRSYRALFGIPGQSGSMQNLVLEAEAT